jgi:hypothetical protein
MRTGDVLTRGFLLLSIVLRAHGAHAQAPARVALASARGAPRPAAVAPAAPSLRISLNAAERDMVVEVGPVDLPADGEHRQLPAFHAAIPADGWLHGYRVELVDGQGRPVPRRILHHVNVIAPGQRELFSPIMLRIAAAGQETAPVQLPRMLGYRVHHGQELIVTSMLHNPTGQAYRGVRLRVHFPYTPAGALLRPVTIFPFYIDVMPPASLHSYDLPPGRSSRSWEASPAVNGRLIGVGGHLHQYGTGLRLEDVTARRVIWSGRPTIAADGEVSDMPQGMFVMKLGVPIYRDHLYRVTADYDNTSGAAIPGGAMGVVGGAFAPDAGASWPGVDRNDPQLKLDWQLVHTGNQDGHGGHHHGGAAPAGHGAMPGMEHGGMAGMEHGPTAAAAAPKAARSRSAAPAPEHAHGVAGHAHMAGMEHGQER